MYNINQTVLDKVYNKIQTKANNNDPRPLIYVTRPTTPIRTQKFWERKLITSTVGTRSSIAVRRPEGSLMGDMIFLAQVEGTNAVIKYAKPTTNLVDMAFETLETIANVSELSIMFDGIMKSVEGKVESYTTGDLPIIFYVTTTGLLKGYNLNTNVTFSISDNAVNVASVLGLYSEAIGLDDGIWLFYTNTAGELWEARILDGEVSELTEIADLPSGVTAWDDIWAGRTFDYRIVLQLKGNDGNVYTLLSASRPSGFGLGVEHIDITNVTVSGRIGLVPPYFVSAENVGVEE